MAHVHTVRDSDAHFPIDPVSRKIRTESSRKNTVIQFDHNSERFTFLIPRYIENHDMSICNNVEIHYLNIDAKTKAEKRGVYVVDDLAVAPDDSSMVLCSWLISSNATQLIGTLNFVVRFECKENGVITYSWNTAIATVAVSPGIDGGEFVAAEYADILAKWKEELFAAGYINAATMQDEIATLRSRMDTFTSLKAGSTTGDAELMDIRNGADGTVYENAGTAVRTYEKKFNALAESSVETGMTEKTLVYIRKETKEGFSGYTTQGATPSQAYGNGTIFPNAARIAGVQLLPTITATKFSAFVFDLSGSLVEAVENITPTISNGAFYFDAPIFVPGGGYMLVRFLDGAFYYKNIGANALKEYQPGTKMLIDSPIKVGIEYIYDEIRESQTFKNETILPAIQLENFDIPRFSMVKNEPYTLYGRWFDYWMNEKAYKATNAAGSSLAFHIVGATKLNVGFHSITSPETTPYFAYSIDGGQFVRQKITDTTIPIVDAGEHWVWIVIDGMGENDPIAGGKWSGLVGVYFTGVSTDGTIHGAESKNKQILFIGDSIVEGINVLGDGENANTNSATRGFAFKTARLLNSIPLLCGYGGTAILGNASFHKPIEAIDYNANGIPANEQFPDIVCIEHGFNDGAIIRNGTYTTDKFKEEYTKLIDRLAIKFPGVQVVCVVPFAQSLRNEIIECAKSRKNCHVVETADWSIAYTDGTHPNEAGANVAAKKLAAALVKIFGKQYFAN